MMKLWTLAIPLTLMAPAWAQVGPTTSMEVTVYNQDLGLVKDHREIEFAEGRSTIRFTDVAAQIDPTSVHFKSVTDPDAVSILEQNYQFDLVDRAKLMQKYLGREVEIVRYDQDGKEVERLKGTLLGAEGGVPGVVKVGDEIVLNPQGTVILPALPEGLIVKPTLVWDVSAEKAGKHEVELSYLTHGLTWAADYVAVINADDTATDLNGWVTLNNTSGARYPDAKLKLIAGDVRVVQEQMARPMMMERAAEAPAGMGGGFQEQPFFEYHIYALQRPTTIAENETKQVSLLSAPGVQVKKLYIFDPSVAPVSPSARPDSDERKVQVKIEVENSEAKGLGMPLPKGKVRVYKADPDGSLQFVGEDMIDHTPRDEKVRLHIGDAFDLVGERKQMRDEPLGDRARRIQVEISLRNHKENETVSITAVEHLWGDWTIDQSNVEAVRKDASTAEFTVDVPAGGEKTISYTATIKW